MTAGTERPENRFLTARLTLGVLAIGMEGLVMAPVLQDIASAFRTDSTQAAWAVSAYGISLAVAAPVVAATGQGVSRKKMMTAGLAVFVLAGLVCAWAPDFWIFVMSRAFCGLAAGTFLPACYAYVGDVTFYENRAKVMGRVMLGWSLALILGVPLGGWVAQSCGWRATFMMVCALGCIALYGVRRLPEGEKSGYAGRQPASGHDLWFSKGTLLLLVVNFLDMSSFFGVYTFLGVAVRKNLNMGSGSFSLFIFFYGIGLFASTLNAKVLDRFGKEKVLMLALTSLIVMFGALALSIDHPLMLAVCMFAWGVLQGIVQTGVATLLTRAADAKRGMVMACMSCTTYLAVGLGSLGGGYLLAAGGFTGLAAAGAFLTFMATFFLSRYIACERGDSRKAGHF